MQSARIITLLTCIFIIDSGGGGATPPQLQATGLAAITAEVRHQPLVFLHRITFVPVTNWAAVRSYLLEVQGFEGEGWTHLKATGH